MAQLEREYDVTYLSPEELGQEAHTLLTISGGTLGIKSKQFDSKTGFLLLLQHNIIKPVWVYQDLFYEWTQVVLELGNHSLLINEPGDRYKVGYQLGNFFYHRTPDQSLAQAMLAHGVLDGLILTKSSRTLRAFEEF